MPKAVRCGLGASISKFEDVLTGFIPMIPYSPLTNIATGPNVADPEIHLEFERAKYHESTSPFEVRHSEQLTFFDLGPKEI